MQRKIYIDAGVLSGTTLESYLEGYEVYGFEPIPKWFEKTSEKYPTVKMYQKAVWTEDGTVKFHMTQRSESCSLFERHDKPAVDIIEVESVNFSQWLLDNFTKDDYIVLKLDIEGAEYAVLDKMIADGSIDLLNKIYIEFHNRIEMKPMSENHRLRRLIRQRGVEVCKWI